MAATNIRIKVKVADLLVSVRAKREEQAEANAKFVKEQEKRLIEWKKAAHAAIDAQTSEEYDHVPNWAATRVTKLEDFDRDIRLLELCADDSLLITASSNFMRYL